MQRSPIPDPIQQLVRAFEQHLPDVRFPGVDAARLQALARQVEAQARARAEARAQLDAICAAFDASDAELRQLSTRALGYARVFAADHPELARALAAVELAPAGEPAATPARRRGRPRKAAPPPAGHVASSADEQVDLQRSDSSGDPSRAA